MDISDIKGSWKVIAAKLKQKYADLTDDDLMFIEGKEEEVLAKLGQKIGQTKEKIMDFISKI